LKEFEGKKLLSATKEGLELEDTDDEKAVFEGHTGLGGLASS
jgi:molecular chaperone HtpG